jgi:Secretion system C-terminal sorting domain/Concanavalin A-like lectin/glucanases superfamily
MRRISTLVLMCFLVTVTQAQTIPPYIPTSGLRALYLFSNNAADSSGLGANGTVYGAVSYGTDRFGHANSCYVGNGATGIMIPSANLPIGNQPRAASIWFKMHLPYTGSLVQMMAWGDNSAVGNRFGLYASDTSLGFESVGACKSTYWTPDTAWHNLIINYPLPCIGTGSIGVYLDGALRSTYVLDSLPVLSTDTGYIRTIGTLFLPPYAYYSWVGALDEAAVWNRGLTPCEIWQVSHSELSVPVSAIVGGDSLCLGTALTCSDAVAGGIWSVSNTHASVSVSGVITSLSPGVDTVFYTVSTPCDTQTVSKEIAIGLGVPVDPIIGPDTLCFPVETPPGYADSTPGGAWSCTNGLASITSAGVLSLIAPGTDTILYTVSGLCGMGTATKVLQIIAYPGLGPIAGPVSVCIGDSVLLTDTAIGGTWTVGGSGATISSTGMLTGVTPGTDTVFYTMSNYCATLPTYIVETVLTALACDSLLSAPDMQAAPTLCTLYPDPVVTVLNITGLSGAEPIAIRICDATGRVWSELASGESRVSIDVHNWPAGIYYVYLTTGKYSLRKKILRIQE